MPDRLTLDPPSPHEMDLIIFAPQGRDAQVLCDMLVQRERGLRCVPVRSLHAVCDRIASGAGAILLTSEAITDDSTVELNASLAQQPPWSDVPIILLTHANRNGERTAPTNVAAVEALKEHANIMVVERPSQVLTMVLTVRAALRARRRQYAVRGYLSEIQSSELQLRIALRAGRMGTWDMDLINSRLVWSDGMFTILGLEPHACAPTIELWRDHVHPDDLERSINEFQRARESGSELVSEQRLVTPDGRVKWVETRARFNYDSSGNAIRATGVAIDVDQRKRSEEQLRTSQQSAEAANLAKDRFLAVLSHELRTPLTPVLAMVQMLQEDPGTPPDVRGPLDMIRRNMELEARLIDDLLDLTRIVRGKFELQHAHIDLHETLKSALAICRHDSAQKRLTISTSLKARRHTIHGDSTRLQQVFWNLLKNAVKFTPEGGEIHVETQDSADGGVVVAVSDTGVGIPPALLPNIFNAFEQGGREMTRAFGGLGLGLTISKAIVEAHGGNLAASSGGRARGRGLPRHSRPGRSKRSSTCRRRRRGATRTT
ncbi:MAG: PAS domain-containing sensor histidine kinase [Tepidisphaeraceae bacterium]